MSGPTDIIIPGGANAIGSLSAAQVNALAAMADQYAAGSRGMVLLERWAPTQNATSHNFACASANYKRLRVVVKHLGATGVNQALTLAADGLAARLYLAYAYNGGGGNSTGAGSGVASLADTGGFTVPDGIAVTVDLTPADTLVLVNSVYGVYTYFPYQWEGGAKGVVPAWTTNFTLAAAANTFLANVTIVELYGEAVQ